MRESHLKLWGFTTVLAIALGALSGCGPSFVAANKAAWQPDMGEMTALPKPTTPPALPPMNASPETLETAQNQAGEAQPSPTPAPTPQEERHLALEEPMTVYHEQKGVLEPLENLPAGTVIELLPGYQVQNLPHRDSNNKVTYSTTGFLSPIRLVSVPDLAETRLNELNQTEGGLYLSASLLQSIEGEEGEFAPLIPATEINPEYFELFEATGQPKFGYQPGLKRRFGDKLNVGAEISDEKTKTKYEKIMAELVRAVSRENPAPRDLMMMNQTLARFHSNEYERSGLVATKGAWSIAVSVTAVRHGFANTPCAEFASEVIRQAYKRAGYEVADDFNKKNRNQLIWHKTAAVAGLSRALFKAGWTVWSTKDYRPPVGAVMLNGVGQTPGHVFFAAGSDGRWIVDNGSPQGRDLQKTSLKTLNSLYKAGAFMLPPGITPQPWSSLSE